MKSKAAKAKLNGRISDYCVMVAKGKEQYSGYKMPGSFKRT